VIDISSFLEFFQRFFRKETSREVARDRLRLVLIQDRASVTPDLIEAIRGELITVISRYMVIDVEGIEMGLERKDGAVALAANIPVIRIKRPEDMRAEMPQTAIGTDQLNAETITASMNRALERMAGREILPDQAPPARMPIAVRRKRAAVAAAFLRSRTQPPARLRVTRQSGNGNRRPSRPAVTRRPPIPARAELSPEPIGNPTPAPVRETGDNRRGKKRRNRPRAVRPD